MFPDEILTDRLLLRRPSAADAEPIFERYGQDLDVCRYLLWTPHRSIDDTHDYLRREDEDRRARVAATYLIFARRSGELLGSVGGGARGPCMQFGYCLARDAWGHGYATEAARAFVEAAMNQPQLWRVQALCDLENPASARVLEKAGLALEGILRRYMVLPNLGDVPRDLLCYARVRDA